MKDKIKIFAYVGSCNVNSTTGIIMRELVRCIQDETGLEVVMTAFCGSKCDIKECVGCTQCFVAGKCALDCKDDMSEIRKRMLEADCIILGSPVYFHAVSGNMKKFMDRISYWTHTMELMGKAGITVATSGGNGLKYVSDYLRKFMDYLGMLDVGTIETAAFNKQYMINEKTLDKMQPMLHNCAKAVKDYLVDGHIPAVSRMQKDAFLMYNKRYEELKEYIDDVDEIRRWYDRGFNEYDCFEDALRAIYKTAPSLN